MAYKSFSYHKSYAQSKARKSDMEKKFDELVNENCSWSYRSQKVVRSNKVDTKTDDSSLELESTVMTIEISGNKYDNEPTVTPSEKSQQNMKHESWLLESPPKVNDAQTNKPRSKYINKNYGPQKKLKTIKGKALRMEPKPKYSKRATKAPNSGRVIQKRNLKPKDEQSVLSSSSDEEILQSRHPTKDREDDENSCDSSTIISDQEMALCEENFLENNVNKKTSPIIIQATAFHKNGSNNIDLLKQKPKDVNLLENNVDEDLHDETLIEGINKFDYLSADSLRVEPHTPNYEKDNYSNEISTGNRNDENNYNENDNLQYLSENVSDIDSDLIEPYIDEFKNVSDDHIISEFLNGSFDLDSYRDANKCPEDNFYSKNLEMNSSTQNDTSLELFTDDMFDLNTFDKRESNNVCDKIKTHKQINAKGYKNESFESPTIQYLSLPMDKKGKRRNNNQQKNVKKIQLERSFDEFDFVPEKTTVKKTSNTGIKRNKTIKSPQLEDALIECINIDNSTEDESKDVNRNKTKNKFKNKNRKPNNLKEKNAATKRYTRSSSLAASKRIRAIEKFENSAPSNDSDICSIHEEINSKVLSKNIQKKLDKITNNHLKNSRIHTNRGKKEILNNHKCNNRTKKNNITDTKSGSTGKRKSVNIRVKNKSVQNIYKNKLNFEKGKYSTLKNKNKKTVNKEWEVNLNLPNYNCNSSDEEDFKNEDSRSKMQPESTENDNINRSANEISGNQKTSAYLLKKNANSNIACEDLIKHKTWDDLEYELLNEFDNEMSIPNAENVSKTIIVKQDRLVKKNRNSNTNVLTLSNASMTQTISKFTKGDSFNVQYAESKYVESKVNTCRYQTRSKFKSSLLNEIVSADSPNRNPILEKTMTAMEECTAAFLKPQENKAKKRLMNIDSLLEEKDTIDPNDMMQFNSDIFEENREFISNEIATFTGNLKRYKSHQNNNISNATGDFNLSIQSHGEAQNSNTEHLNSFAHKTNASENNQEKNKSQEIVPFNREIDSPWNKLIYKLQQNDLNHLQDTYKATKPITNDDLISLKNLEKNILDAKNIMQEEINTCDGSLDLENSQVSIKKRRSKKSLNNEQVIEESNSLEIEKSQSFDDNITPMDSISEQGENDIEYNNIDNYENKNNSARSKKIKMLTMNRTSPIYKLKEKKDGSVKLGFKSSSSEDSMEMKSVPNSIKKTKKKIETDKAKNKYINYVKNLSEKVFTLETDKTPENNAEAQKFSSLVDSVKNRNISENEIKTPNPTLIAENDDDIFSLSSSDSEDNKSKEEIHGTGHMCDLFDE